MWQSLDYELIIDKWLACFRPLVFWSLKFVFLMNWVVFFSGTHTHTNIHNVLFALSSNDTFALWECHVMHSNFACLYHSILLDFVLLFYISGIYSPNAYRGFAREFIKDLERIRLLPLTLFQQWLASHSLWNNAVFLLL